MALGSEMSYEICAMIKSEMRTKKEAEVITIEENMTLFLNHKEVKKKGSQVQKVHVCPYKDCEQSFSRPWRLASHVRCHTGKRSHMCKFPGCRKAYFNSSHLRRHIATSHRLPSLVKKALKCPYPSCMMQLSSLCNLKRHYLRIHEQPRPFTCSFCGKGFSKHGQWQGHLYEHTGVPPITCPTCHLGFKSLRDFNRHNRKHRTIYTCDFPNCGQRFERHTHLRSHIGLCHPKEFICDICNKSFKLKCRLLTHMSVHQEPSQREAVSCPYSNCSRSYCHKKNLAYHIEVSHKSSEQSAKNVIPQRKRKRLKNVSHGQDVERTDAPQEGSTVEELRAMPEGNTCGSSSCVFPQDGGCFSLSRDCDTKERLGGGEITIKVEPDSDSDAHQSPSRGETENPVHATIKTDILHNMEKVKVEPGPEKEISQLSEDALILKTEYIEELFGVSTIKDEMITEEHEVCLDT